jgi:hypothetical protein
MKAFYIDEDTRITVRFHLIYGNRLCLQRRGKYLWKTVSYTFPSIFKDRSLEDIIRYLVHAEINLTEKEIGERMVEEMINTRSNPANS